MTYERALGIVEAWAVAAGVVVVLGVSFLAWTWVKRRHWWP